MEMAPAVAAGQAAYTPFVLRFIYDVWVLGISNRWLWRCPTPRLLQFFNDHVSGNHLDVGVGTGWFLDHGRFPVAGPRLGLLDLNPNSLARTAARIARYRPEVCQADILRPVVTAMAPFDSVSMMYLLHCLPGPMATKAAAFDQIQPLMGPRAVLFGATLVQGAAPRSTAARHLMELYNRKGIFGNRHDTVEELEAALRSRFSDVAIKLIGCVACFRAR